MRHWLPFEEPDLYGALRMERRDVLHWLDSHERTIAGLARRRGLSRAQLLDRLMQPWAARVTSAQLALLRSHARRVLTQSHLSRHLLFHLFHNRRIGWHARAIFGVSQRRWWHLRRSGATPFEVGALGGRSRRQVRRALWRFLVREQAAGVHAHRTSRTQADRFLAEEHHALPAWLRHNRLGHHGMH